jgi:hypothetical protein
VVDWYMKGEAEIITEDNQYRGDSDWKVPYLFYNGRKWKQDDSYMTKNEFESLERVGTKFGNKVWRSDTQ